LSARAGGGTSLRALALAHGIRVGRSALTGSLAAAFASQLILVVSGIIAARMLGPRDRGYLALLVLIPLIVSQIGSLGLPAAVTYYVAAAPGQARTIVRRLTRPVLQQIALMLLCQLAVNALFLAHEPDRVRTGAVIALSLTVFIFVQQLLLSLLQGLRLFVEFNILRVLPSAVYSVAIFVAFAAGTRSVLTVLVLLTASNGAVTILIGAAAVRGLRRTADGVRLSEVPRVGDVYHFGLKGFLGSVSPVENLRLDQASIALFLNPVALGLYVVAQSFTNLPRFVAQSIGMIAYPTVASEPDRTSARRKMWRYTFLSALLSVGVVAVLEAAATPLVRVLFGAAFVGAVDITRILLLGVVFLAARRTLTEAARGVNRPGAGSVAEAASWVALVILFGLLVPSMGAVGVAISLSAAWAFSLAVLVLAVKVDDWSRVVGPLRRARMRVVPYGTEVFGPLGAAAVVISAASSAALLPVPASLLLLAAVLGSLVLAHVRSQLRRHTRRLAAARVVPIAAPTDHDPGVDLRFARVLYLFGLAFIAELSIRPLRGFTLSDWFFLAALPATFAGLVVRQRRLSLRDLPTQLIVGMTLLVIGGLVASVDAASPVHSIAVILRLVYITIVWFWVATVVLPRVSHVRTAVGVWVISVAVSGAAACAQSVLGNIFPGGEVAWGRNSGLTQNFNDLGGLCAVAFVPALMLMLDRGARPLFRLVFAAALVCIAGGLLFSGSVGSVLAVAAAAAVWFGSHSVGARRIFALALLAGAVFVGYAAQTSLHTPDAIQRIVGVGNGAPQDPTLTLRSRVTSYRIAWDRIQQDPFVGKGLDNESRRAGDFQVHNIVLGTWYSAGFIGLVGMIVIFLAGLRAGWATAVHARSPEERSLALALGAGFTAFIVFLMSEPALFTRYGWVAVALIFALRAAQRRRDGHVAEEAAPAPVVGSARDVVAPGMV
jgi:O-antigen/teichoic acid export membrane protein/O-antigen ligase